MLEGVRAIGEAALGRVPLVEALVDTRALETRKSRLVVTIDLCLDPPSLEPRPQEMDEKTLREVVWVGNTAANSPQDRLTTDHPEYLTSQTVPNLLSDLPDGELKRCLQRLKGAVYIDLGKKSEVFPEGGGDQQYERYRYMWDLRKLGLDSDEALAWLPRKERTETEVLCQEEGVAFLTEDFLRVYARRRGKAKDACELVGRMLEGWVKQKLGSSQIQLYTLAVEGKRLVRHPDYLAYLERKLVLEIFKGDLSTEGVCYLCNAKGRVTADTTRFKLLKFYITDKPGFASELREEGFLCNYTLCEGCYRALLSGERFVENELRTGLGRTNVYVIPTFHAPEAYPTAETLAEWAQYLKGRLAASDTLEKWHEFQRQLEKYRNYEEQKALFVLNFLFATKGQAAVKVDKLIAEVPPSRLDQLDEVRNRVRAWAAEHLGADVHGEWDLGLEKVFYLLPLRQRDRQVEAKPYLDLLDALLTGRPLSARALILQLLETAAIHRFKRYDAHVQHRPKDPEQALVVHLVQAQLFLRYLKDLGQLRGLYGNEIEGGERKAMMETTAGQIAEIKSAIEIERALVDEGLRDWMDGLGLAGARRGLFLLGVLIGKIGSTREQRESGKPILNKLHFQGMDWLKVMRLANEVYEKLRQYKIADYNEGLYGVMKAHLDRGVSKNELGSPQENVYWVLAGYAYETQRAIRTGRLKKSQQAEAGTEVQGAGEEAELEAEREEG
jgi:CRISPR-associated protein Csh1